MTENRGRTNSRADTLPLEKLPTEQRSIEEILSSARPIDAPEELKARVLRSASKAFREADHKVPPTPSYPLEWLLAAALVVLILGVSQATWRSLAVPATDSSNLSAFDGQPDRWLGIWLATDIPEFETRPTDEPGPTFFPDRVLLGQVQLANLTLLEIEDLWSNKPNSPSGEQDGNSSPATTGPAN